MLLQQQHNSRGAALRNVDLAFRFEVVFRVFSSAASLTSWFFIFLAKMHRIFLKSEAQKILEVLVLTDGIFLV